MSPTGRRLVFAVMVAWLMVLTRTSLAARWVVTLSAGGNYTSPSGYVTNWTTPSLPMSYTYSGSGSTGTGTNAGSVQATLTWTPDFVGDTTPPPSRIVVKETAYATVTAASGSDMSTSIDFGDVTTTTASGVRDTESIYARPVDNTFLQTTITLPVRNLSAACSKGTAYAWQFQVKVGYSASVYPTHEHPTNMRVYGTPLTTTPPNASQDGTLHFQFVWDSTSGKVYGQNLSELSSTWVSEYVTYSEDGQHVTTTFTPVSPPFPANWHIDDPTTGGGTRGDLPPLGDEHEYPSAFVSPYSAKQFTGSQDYRFHCSICMDDGEYQRLLGPFSVTREVYQSGLIWYFRISKLGYTSTLVLGTGP